MERTDFRCPQTRVSIGGGAPQTPSQHTPALSRTDRRHPSRAPGRGPGFARLCIMRTLPRILTIRWCHVD